VGGEASSTRDSNHAFTPDSTPISVDEVAVDQGARDDDAVYLACPFDDHELAGVAVVAFERVIAHIALRAQHLEGVGGHFDGRLGGEGLRY